MLSHLKALYAAADAAFWNAVNAHSAALAAERGAATTALDVELAAAHRDAIHTLIEIAEGRDPRRVSEEHAEHLVRAIALVEQSKLA